MEKYNPQTVEKKWQKAWEAQDPWVVDNHQDSKETSYILDMFPYPSGTGLHMGHIENFTATDVLARYKRMRGYSVLRPMGWDAFGLPAENYAIKTGIHPRQTTSDAITNFRRQIKRMGLSYDFKREIGTQSPDYYKWTQWFFLLLYNNNLAFRSKAKVNWDPQDQTVLANEQVLPDGTAERSGAKVEQKELEQWFFRITEFAEELHNDLDDVDWPPHTVANQRNWIGKSEGYMVDFQLHKSEESVRVFTTRLDTLMGVACLIVSSDHPLLTKVQNKVVNWSVVSTYCTKTQQKSVHTLRQSTDVSGVRLEGVVGVHPVTQRLLPVYVADFIVSEYGTGAVMAVPAHDKRDWKFAHKYDIPFEWVVKPVEGGRLADSAYEEYGVLINSGAFNDMPSAEAKEAIAKQIGAQKTTSFRLRDWLISRQRYWGCPIPVVYSPDGKPHPIPEEHLPWTLPIDVEFLPKGESPLVGSKEFVERTERIFGKGWRPECDTMDTFVDSSWYFFRFCDPHNNNRFANKQAVEKWMPVDLYMGGAEHTVLHLLYARFFTKVLHKLGHVTFNEPFATLRHQGTILGEDNYKMSKSRGNVVNPDDIVEAYGADTVRMFVLFMGPLEDSKAWNPQNIAGVHRFLGRVWGLVERSQDEAYAEDQESIEVQQKHHSTVKKVTEDVENLRYNTAISSLMEFVNVLYAHPFSPENIKALLIMLAPFAPYITEELWEKLGEKKSIHSQPWCEYNENFLTFASYILPISVNGKVRATVSVPHGASEEEMKEIALKQSNVQKHLEGKTVQNILVKEGVFVNIII